MAGDHAPLVVCYGGPSAEHDVSCVSAAQVVRAAVASGRRVLPLGITHDRRWVAPFGETPLAVAPDRLGSPDDLEGQRASDGALGLLATLAPGTVVFPVLHGPYGEDGVIQGLLESVGLAYVGSGVLSSALCMDKAVAKSVLQSHGLPQARFVCIRRVEIDAATLAGVLDRLGLPVFVKPANLGSSIGVSRARSLPELEEAVALACRYDEFVVIEEEIRGREIELAVIGNDSLTVSGAGEIVPSRGHYDYEDKYLLDAAALNVPAGLTEGELATAQSLAARAYRALRAEGLARVDFFLHPERGFLVNELNTMPGFTPASMFPLLWSERGLELPALVDELVALALERHERRRGLRTLR